MICPQCNKLMKVMPYLSISNPPQDEYECKCGYVRFQTIGEHNHATIWDYDSDYKLDFSKEYDVKWINEKND